ncbi:GGDEF domain-containing protein [Sciscionella marina]|uniref:GGDEF domain-containing protein n=1 Tax=Sciscionella marina TaxID=508770 RepID=UPI00036673A5|nr:GGDEF domain-containing protein [Sciscionella marina]
MGLLESRAAADHGHPRARRRSGAAELHESLAALLAERGEYESAYRHMRMAMNILRDGTREAPEVSEELRIEVARLRREHAEAMQQSMRDSLTDTYNRRYLDSRLLDLVDEQRSSEHGVAVALVDIDWFKRVNDTYGHRIGDLVLQQVVLLLQRDLPEGAFCARYGGEEFVLVYPDTDLDSAIAHTDATRTRVARHDWSRVAEGLRLTVSIGIRHQGPQADLDSERQLRSADRLLYTAKRAGRNAVVYSDGGVAKVLGGSRGRFVTRAE